jgi:hypothetical protein
MIGIFHYIVDTFVLVLDPGSLMNHLNLDHVGLLYDREWIVIDSTGVPLTQKKVLTYFLRNMLFLVQTVLKALY